MLGLVKGAPAGAVEAAVPVEQRQLPLAIDLDGTLLATDSLHEVMVGALRHDPFGFLRASTSLFAGRAAFKAALVNLSPLDIDTWPINAAFADYVRRQADAGRHIVLVTAADRAIAEAIAARFPFIRQVIASNGRDNCKGAAKAEILTRMFPDGFEYAGDSAADLSVWQASSRRIVVNASPDVLRRVMQLGEVVAVFRRPAMHFGTIGRALRLHQWAKNALVFVPLVLGGKAGDLTAWMTAFIGFVALGLTASATYLINDLWDLPSDRRHWSKQTRPLASGQISIRLAVLMVVAGLVAGFGLAALTGPSSLAMLALYTAGTLAYSFGLKRIPIIDILVLASLFTVRLGLGIFLVNVRVSPWLLVFSMFLFVSLSMAKRHTEVVRLTGHGLKNIAGRGYVEADAPLTLGTGLASMFGAILILVMYLIEDAFPRGIYGTPALLWGMPPILFMFLGRVWLVAQRGQLRDDPVAFALKDRISLCLGIAMGVVVAGALVPV